MAGTVYPEAFREDRLINPIIVGTPPVRTGTFAFRRGHYLNEIERGLLLSAEQRHALLHLIKEGDFDAKQKVIAHNLRLVAGIAMRYANRGVDFMVLVSEGIMGLINALENFEREGSFRFSVYARLCIRENIERAVHSQNCGQPARAI